MDGIGWAAGAMSAAQQRLDVAAENLANGSTDGFRKTLLRGRLSASGIVLRSSRSVTQGPLRRTGRDLDLALSGRGAFRVRDGRGAVVRSRAGAFVRDRFGHLRDAQGRVLLGAGNAPLCVPQGAEIERDGTVRSRGSVVGRLALPPGTTVNRGFLEASDVDAIGEMIDVMTAGRSFETAQKVLSAIDGTRERAASQVGVVKG